MAQAEQRWFGNRLKIAGSAVIMGGGSLTSADINTEVGFVGTSSLYITSVGSGSALWVCTDGDAGTWVALTID